MPDRYLRYGNERYIITLETEARLDRALDSVYAGGNRNHEWLSLYPGTEAPCRLLIAPGVPITVETLPGLDD